MIIYKYLLILLVLFQTSALIAQPFEKPSNNLIGESISTFYLEVGGNAILASVNYDLLLTSYYGIRVGISPGLIVFDEDDSNTEFDLQGSNFIGILSAYKLHGTSSHRLETGIGVVVGEFNTTKEENYPSIPGIAINVGYRFISKREKGLSLRAIFTPILSNDGFTPWIGASIGFSFKNKLY